MNTDVNSGNMPAPEELPRARRATVYMPTVFVQAMLPCRDPGPESIWTRTSGRVTIRMQSGLRPTGTHNAPGPGTIGLPYGTYARLLLSWVATEALRNKSPDIRLGRDMPSFASSLGLNSMSGGPTGQLTRLIDQIRRLFASSVTMIDSSDEQRLDSGGMTSPFWSTGTDFYENPFGCRVSLSDDFYRELVSHSVRLDPDCVRVLNRSPLALDIYCWLRTKADSQRGRRMFTWEELREQFGSQAVAMKKFRELWRASLARALEAHPQIETDFFSGGVIVRPCATPVSLK